MSHVVSKQEVKDVQISVRDYFFVARLTFSLSFLYSLKETPFIDQENKLAVRFIAQ